MALHTEFREIDQHITESLFGQRDESQKWYQKALTFRTPVQLLSLRDHFGEGEIGTKSFTMIALGEPCPQLGVNKQTQEPVCQNMSVGTWDADACGEVDFTPFCQDHERLALVALQHDLSPQRRGGIGRNGRGRA